MSIFADHVHPFMDTVYPCSDGCFEEDKAPCYKAQIISNWFLKHDRVHRTQSPDLRPILHLCDVEEKEVSIMDVHLINLQVGFHVNMDQNLSL